MLRSNFGLRLKYKSRIALNSIIETFGGNGIYNIKHKTSKNGKHALIIYTAEAVSKYLSKTEHEFAHMNSHSGFQESICLLNILLEIGYTVDYFNMINTPKIDWSKYELVIDAGKNLQYAKPINGQKKIFYATSFHWKKFYENAYKHVDSFYERNNLLLYPDRLMDLTYSDDFADIITCFGGNAQKLSFGKNAQKIKQLNISTTFNPANERKQIATKTKFIWYGGYGPFHKGLDIVVEAFSKMPEFELHIFGDLELNPELKNWFYIKADISKNMTYHGWAEPSSKKFLDYVKICDAFIFTSSSEGGAGSVIQCLQHGLIPIINRSTSVDIENELFGINSENPLNQIEEIINSVNSFNKTETEILQQYSEKLKQKYCTNNNIKSFETSFKASLI